MTTQLLLPHHGPEDCGYETGLQWKGPSERGRCRLRQGEGGDACRERLKF